MAGPNAGTGLAKPSAGTGVAGPRAGTGLAKPSAGTGVAGPSTGTGVAGPNAGTGMAGSSAGSGVAGPSAGTGVAGPSAGTVVTGPSAGTGVAEPSAGTGMAGPGLEPATDDFRLEPAEAEVLAADAANFAGALRDASAQERYLRLAAAAAAGAVPSDLVPALETMLELLSEKGRLSNRAVLQSIFGRTPRGRQQRAAAREVNSALRALRGHTLLDVQLTAGPSRHTLVLETDRCRLTLELDAAGARVGSLEAG